MKKVISAVLVLGVLFTVFSGCAQNAARESPVNINARGAGEESGRISIVSTIFPPYDWVRQILGDRADDVDLTLLTDGVDLHSFQPSVEDIVKISSCDLFIYVGGESDAWVGDALAEAANPDMKVINLVETLGAGIKTEEIVEGMQDEEDDHGDEEAHVEEPADEHVWLSLKNAEVFCAVIADALCALDPANAEEYKGNLDGYIQSLQAVDSRYSEIVNEAPGKTLLFGDRFPFRYLVDDYGLRYYAAFPGCSAETEASFETIVFLSEKINEEKLRNVIVTESADQSIAKTIIDNAGDETRQILVMNALQSVTSQDVENGADYLAIMEENGLVLQTALSA